jgi:hypothetical protein
MCKLKYITIDMICRCTMLSSGLLVGADDDLYSNNEVKFTHDPRLFQGSAVVWSTEQVRTQFE